MSDELTLIWRMRLRVLFAEVAGLKAEMQWVRLRLGSEPTPPTPSSPPSSSSPTDLPSKASQTWLQRIAGQAFDKLGREALTQFGLWVLAKLALWVAPWLVAWWTMGGPLLRFLERWAAFFLG